jgi:gluconokinase
MGVSGSGKSTVMAEIARLTGWRTAEGDDFHPLANVKKMRGGVPLTDDDRGPWLGAIADWIGVQEAAGVTAIVTCSALRRRYRDVLRVGHQSVWFAHLDPAQHVIEARLDQRTDHFMPPTLLSSQFAIVEALEPGEPGIVLDASASPDQCARLIITALADEQG